MTMDTLGTGVHWGGDTSKGKCSQAAIFTRKADVPRPEMKYEKEINLGSFQWASVDEGPWKCRHAITIPKESFNFFTDNTATLEKSIMSQCYWCKFGGGAVCIFSKKLNFEKYCFESRLFEAIERAMDPYIGIKQDRDDDELDDNEIRSVGVFVNDSECFI